MRVSVVTPILDEADTLDELIEALRAQTRAPDEWIVVDGGSKDDSVKIAAGAGDCRVLEVAGNIARGRNAGISAASGEIIALVDAGCRPAPAWLESLTAPIENDSAAITAGPTLPVVSTAFQAAQAALLDQFVLPGPSPRQPALSARSLAFRVDVWRRVRFPEWLDHGEDAWLLREWRRRGYAIVRVPGARVEWALRSSVAAVLRQHFLYMRGDGRALMNLHRHLFRFGFCGLVATLCLLAPSRSWWVAGALWSAYALLSSARLGALDLPAAAGFRWRSLAWTIALLPLIDLAKATGFVVGVLERGRRG